MKLKLYIIALFIGCSINVIYATKVNATSDQKIYPIIERTIRSKTQRIRDFKNIMKNNKLALEELNNATIYKELSGISTVGWMWYSMRGMIDDPYFYNYAGVGVGLYFLFEALSENKISNSIKCFNWKKNLGV